ncbi:cardiolipin synthase [Shewanella sp. Scap07]|uniref:cardiolipin synthase n=1 Tax=Shewanella sp. Scap07 TaxID=2589987 RepID=UPI0015B8F289|nr:cardiolipin synthase [Shewanella sp. Scap07]QLE85515.1 cardiolipin synthase [Shewanella sp. Scap07]
MENFYQILTLLSVLLYWLVLAGVVVRVISKRRNIGVSLAWMLIIYFVPFVGVIAYLMFGELNLGKTRAKRAIEMYEPYKQWFAQLYQLPQHRPEKLSSYARSISAYCDTHVGIPSLSDNQMTLKTTPEQILSAIIDDIDNAQSHIFMEFYIWYPGGLADDVANALIKASQRGVKVKLLIDSAGSRQFFKSSWPKNMRSHHIEVIEALKVSPLRMFFRRLDLRLHRKIVIIDNRIGYTGSMNMVDPKCFKQNAGVGQWIDVMVRIVGPSVPVMSCIHAWDWEVETNQRTLPAIEVQSDAAAQSDNQIQVIPSGPGMPEQIIHQVLMQSIYQATESIVITTPYFVPSENLQNALIAAANRGVNVNIIIPRHNDSTMVKWASRSFFNDLLKAGVNIYRFKGGLLHTKSVVVDNSHCLIGTVNVDMRSLWLNFEVTLAVDERAFTQSLIELQQGYMADSEKLDYQRWQRRPYYKRVIEQVFYLFSPLL